MKNKTIKIIISDGLTASEESNEISVKLRQKLLAGNANQLDKKRIGDDIDIQHLTTNILIIRKGDKPIEMIKCNVCKCDYQSDMYKPVLVNYGGKNKTIKTCSTNCQDLLISMCGPGRAGKKKPDLTPVNFYK